MPTRNYSSTAGLMQLVSPVTSVATTVSVDAVGGLPDAPFTLVLDPGMASEEITTVTEVSGTSLTVVRAEDGSSAVAHSAGAVARHMATARDFSEWQAHTDATTDVHGVGGGAELVGTTTAQVLTGKEISGADNTLTDIPGDALVDGSVPGSALGDDVDAATWAGITPFIQSATPTHSGPAGSAIWFVTT